MYKNISYFNGLNGLRFIAAFLVVLHHAEQIRMKYGLFHLKDFSLFNNGGLAVTFFFVLSGFLITYLLLKEQIQTNTISVKKFYMRRVLRIWPLYFLLVSLGTVFIPAFLQLINNSYKMPYDFQDVILYFLFFAPFMVNISFGHHLLEPLWSIGVEELFYIVWAPLLKFLKKNILKIIIVVIITKSFTMLLVSYFNINQTVTQVLSMLQFEAMAIGGLGAYLIYYMKKDISNIFLFSIPFQVIVLLIIFLRIFAYNVLIGESTIFKFLFSSVLFSDLLIMSTFLWLIINISLNKKALIKFNNKYLDFLGNISYGIYMYHMIVIFGIILILQNQLEKINDLNSTIFFYVIITTTVIVVSAISKKFFEDRFLRLNNKYKSAPERANR